MTYQPPDIAKIATELARSIPASVEAARKPIPEIISRVALLELAADIKRMSEAIEVHAMRASVPPLVFAAAAMWKAMHEMRRVVKELDGAPSPEKAGPNA